MKSDYIFTSESVTDGHPDKLCDQISDAIVDEYLQQDPYARIVAEAAVTTGVVFLAARFAAAGTVDVAEVARRVIQEVGYEDPDFNARDCTIMAQLRELPDQEYRPLDERVLDEKAIERIVARNQVNVFGFACNQTPALMPAPVFLAHGLARRLAELRLGNHLSYLFPDGKTQVGVEYRERCPRRIHSITLIAAQQSIEGPSLEELRDDLMAHVVNPVFEGSELRPDADTHIWINPEGLFIGGGPATHSGLTGRKSAIDTYGEYARQSGAALSGKDPARIDRVGAYAARYAAKNVVAAGLADECEVLLGYSIGQSRPVSIQVETFGTARIDERELVRRVERVFDFRPAAIVRDFDLRHLPAREQGGFYNKLAAYGHVGRVDMDLPWERLDRVEALR